jgi:hypothetical protein
VVGITPGQEGVIDKLRAISQCPYCQKRVNQITPDLILS